MDRTARLVVGAVAVALTVAGFASLPHIQPLPGAMAVLEDARAFVRAHPTARYRGEVAMRFKNDDGDLGSTMTFNAKVLGEIESASRFREIRNSGADGVEETLLIDNTMYMRAAETVAGLASEKFESFDTDVSSADADMAAESNDFDALAILNAATDPTIVSHADGVTTIAVDVDPVKVMGKEAARGIDSFTAKIAVGDGGEVQTIEERVRGEAASATSNLAFRDWGAVVQVAEPRAEQIDATPGIAEEAIAIWDDAPLYQPKNIPAGWALDYADVLPAEETGEGCEQVEIDIDPADVEVDFDSDEEPPYLTLYQLPTSCAEDFGGPGVVPFRAGRHSGYVSTDDDGYSFVQMTLDEHTTLQAESNMTVADLAVVLAEFQILDFHTIPGSIEGLGLKPISA